MFNPFKTSDWNARHGMPSIAAPGTFRTKVPGFFGSQGPTCWSMLLCCSSDTFCKTECQVRNLSPRPAYTLSTFSPCYRIHLRASWLQEHLRVPEEFAEAQKNSQWYSRPVWLVRKNVLRFWCCCASSKKRSCYFYYRVGSFGCYSRQATP